MVWHFFFSFFFFLKQREFYFLFIYLFIYLFIFGCVGSSLLCAGLSLVAASGDYSSLQCMGVSLRWLLSLRSTGSRRVGFSGCGSRAQLLWRTGPVALQHVGSSCTRDWTCVPCISRRILNHCATREVPMVWLLISTNGNSAVWHEISKYYIFLLVLNFFQSFWITQIVLLEETGICLSACVVQRFTEI